MPMPTRWPERMFSSHSTAARAALEKIAEERQVTVSALIRVAVEEYLEREGHDVAVDTEAIVAEHGVTTTKKRPKKTTRKKTTAKKQEASGGSEASVEVSAEAAPDEEPKKRSSRVGMWG